MAFATLGIVLFLFFVVRLGRGRLVPSWLVYVCDVLIVLAFVYLLLLFGLRWYVSGHLPLANGYETMQFMALSLLLLTLVMQRRFLLVLPFGFLLGGLTLLVSMMGQSNPQITHLMPVLQSPLLSLHVCVIMISYSLLAFTFLTGLAALLSRQEAFVQQLADVSRMLLYPALFCMAAGIFIGAIWANVSWGRYWGWDPKEVWALITLLVYAFAFHSESLPIFRRPRFFHIFMVLAFLTVLMTYFGVNFVLGGMHSYATS
jgi:ABC-type transport system involved in cytochrome c biogenesis permease subunit